MSYKTGIAGSIGFAEETTWGTHAVATRFYEISSESLQQQISRIESPALRQNRPFTATDRWTPGTKSVSGDISLEMRNKGMGLFLKQMLGTAAGPVTDGAGYQHTFTPGDLSGGQSLSAEIGRPFIDGTVKAYLYSGLKVSSWTLSNAVDGLLELQMSMDGKIEDTSGSLAGVSYPAADEMYTYMQGTVVIGGTTYPLNSWTLTGNNALKVDRYKINGSQYKLEQIVNAFREYSGSVEMDFIDQTLYSDYVNGSLATITITYQTTTTYDTAKPYKFVITLQNCRFDGTTVNITGPDVLTQTLPFKCLDDRTNPIVKFDYYTSDATP